MTSSDPISQVEVRSRFLFRLAALAVFAGILLGAAPALAHDELPRRRDRAQARAALRKEFLNHRRPVEPLQPLAFTPCVGGMAGSYPCNRVDLQAFLPLASIGGGNGNSIWGWTDPLTNREYAIFGRSSGTSFVDITDPANPIYLGNLPTRTVNSSWRDMKVYQNHAYIVSEANGHGMQVFDLTRLRTVTSPPVTFTATANYSQFSNCHTLAINEESGFAYAVGTNTCSGGLHMINLQNPAAPVFAGCHSSDGYTHETQCVIYNGPDVAHQGKEICMNSNEDTLDIVDVTNKSAAIRLSTTSYTGMGYTHQGWLTPDHVYFILNDELDESNLGHNTRTRVFNVSDLDAPFLFSTYDGPTTATDHNLYVHNGYVYEANYRAGLRILDLANLSTGVLTEAAFFDIYPSSNSNQMNGAWNVYPFFPSGNVIVSGIEQGLFVLRPNLAPDFILDVSRSTLAVCAPGDDTVTVTLTPRNGYFQSVTPSVQNLPAGASASFSVNPITPPGTSGLTISVNGTPPGHYPFMSLRATDGTITRTRTLGLVVTAPVTAQPGLTAPADGATNVPRTPLLSWSAAPQAASYRVEISTDPSFGALAYNAIVVATSHSVPAALAADTLHYWRVRATNACGDGPWSAASSFRTAPVPAILLVDDDDNGPNVRAFYTDALNALGRTYDIWDTANTDNEPSAFHLAPYKTVVWFTGDEFGGVAGPGAAGEAALATWLDSSRCLLIASQDYHWDRGVTAFMQGRLGVASVTNDVSHTSATGQGGVFSGLGPWPLAFPYPNFTDRVLPNATAETAFTSAAGSMGIDKDTGLYRTSYWGFGLEAIATGGNRATALGRFLAWCDALALADADGDGVPNGADCAVSDPTVWSKPSPARDLLVDKAPVDNLQWTQPVESGGTSVVYDVIRSGSAADFTAATCVASGISATAATDAADPPSEGVFYYLVRSLNTCGSNLGASFDGTPRAGVGCSP